MSGLPRTPRRREGAPSCLPRWRPAAASARPVVVVSDGEIEDLSDIPSDLLAHTSVRCFRADPAWTWP
jgi:hypothetical protein